MYVHEGYAVYRTKNRRNRVSNFSLYKHYRKVICNVNYSYES